jgi:hypothetical protein
MFTIIVYAINVVIHGIFLRKMNEKKLAKYLLSIFPTVVVSSLMEMGIKILNVKQEILLIAIGILLLYCVLYWYEIVQRSKLNRYLKDYSLARINLTLSIPIINLFIMTIWLLFSTGKERLIFSDGASSEQEC